MYWLAYRLRAHGERAYYPGLPFEDLPTYDEWRAALRWSLLQIDDASERVVVCNSMACLLWFRFATDRRPDERPVERLLLVVPPESARIPDAASTFRIDALDAAAVRATCTQTIRVAFGDEDPFNPGQGARGYADAIGAEADVIAGAGTSARWTAMGPGHRSRRGASTAPACDWNRTSRPPG
jgi:hypothetical protein